MKALFIFILSFSSFCFAQQTEEFKLVKNYYNQHRTLLNKEFKKKYEAEKNPLFKLAVKKDFLFFMKKMDSIENVALIGALLKVKNLEDLQKIGPQKYNLKIPKTSENIDKIANYPGGINALRKEVASLFYGEGVQAENGYLKTKVAFIVELDGTISNVKAEGENFTFNRQAEIALYSISEKFFPASVKGSPVRYQLKLPLVMNFE